MNSKDSGKKTISSSWFYWHGLYFPESFYQKSIIEMNSIIIQNDGQSKIIGFDTNNESFPVGYIPIMYGILPQTQKGNEYWELYNNPNHNCPEIFRNYINYLKDYCGVNNIILRYNEVDNAFIIFVNLPSRSHKLMVDRCKGANYVIENTPFIEIYYPESDYSLSIDSEEVMQKRTDQLKSYFYYSLFHDITSTPDKPNIGPYNSEYLEKDNKSGYLSINCIEVLLYDRLSIRGNFNTTNIKKADEFNYIVRDSGEFLSVLSFSQNEVSISTNADTSRKIRKDNFFSLSEDVSKGVAFYTEHFVKIANGTRLLHYSDEYDYFEIFELPNNWFIENGLSLETTGEPKVFNDVTYDKEDKDLKEVYDIIAARKEKCWYSTNTKKIIK